jgi:hypothetical protein
MALELRGLSPYTNPAKSLIVWPALSIRICACLANSRSCNFKNGPGPCSAAQLIESCCSRKGDAGNLKRSALGLHGQ